MAKVSFTAGCNGFLARDTRHWRQHNSECSIYAIARISGRLSVTRVDHTIVRIMKFSNTATSAKVSVLVSSIFSKKFSQQHWSGFMYSLRMPKITLKIGRFIHLLLAKM